jgi:non-ribosomal peptide synthetase component F
MVEHKEVVCFCFKNNYLSINGKTVTLAFSNYVFDGSVFDIFSTLLNSGKLILANKDDILNASKLEQLLLKHSVNSVFITTALFTYYSKLKEKNPLNHVSNLLFGGEKINIDDLEVFLQENKKFTNLIHVYGPTENIVFSTYCYISEENKLQAPIGKKLSDKILYILDRGMQPVPIGVSGELYIGGAGLARGYLNRAVLTAEKFVPNPFIDIDKENTTEVRSLRLYRTGDLVRCLPDGNIEFLGRIDDQVKIRGFRIELGEIEACLNQYEEGHKQLVAYVIPKEEVINASEKILALNSAVQLPFHTLKGASITGLTEKIRNHLAFHLPDYMIPAFFVFIDKVPLNPNGKIDKKILPSPDLSLRQIGEEYLAPQTILQLQLAAI